MKKIKVGLFALTASAVGLFAFRAPDSSNVKPFGTFNYSDTSHRDSTHHKDKWKKKDGHKKDTTVMLNNGDSSMMTALITDSSKRDSVAMLGNRDSSAMLALNSIIDSSKMDSVVMLNNADSSMMVALNNVADTSKKDTAKKDTLKKVIALTALQANDSSVVAKAFADSNAVGMDSMAFAFNRASDSLQISKLNYSGDSIVAIGKDSMSHVAYNVHQLQQFVAPARTEVRAIYS